MLIIFEVQIELPIIRLDGLFERLEQVMVNKRTGGFQHYVATIIFHNGPHL